MKERGSSTLGGQNIWFDEEVRRLNADGRGVLLGEFAGDDKIVVFTRHHYYVTGYELTHHFPEDTVRVEKWDAERIYSVTYYDEGQRFFYVKRFPAVTNGGGQQEYLESDCRLVEIVDFVRPRLEVSYKGANAARPSDVVDVAEYIGIKSHKAKGKRITTYEVGGLLFSEAAEVQAEPDEGVDEEAIDEAQVDKLAPEEVGLKPEEEDGGSYPSVKTDGNEIEEFSVDRGLKASEEVAETGPVEGAPEWAEPEPVADAPVELEIVRGEQLDLF
jgi:topoisomerase-4 subunit A